MKIRRIVIVGLLLINIGLIIYMSYMKTEATQSINSDNVTTNKTIEQEEAMEHKAFIKEEYVLVLPEGENVALEKKTTASSYADVYTARKATDGLAEGPSYWEGKSDSYPNTVTVDLEENTTIHAIRVCLSPMTIWAKRTQTFLVEISNDDVTYTELVPMKMYTFDPNTGNEVQLHFDEIEVRYVRLTFTENSGASGGQVAELEIYSK